MDPTKSSRHRFSYFRYGEGIWQSLQAGIVAEKQVALSLNGKIWLQLLCTPIDLDFLALGFLYNENIIKTITDIANLRVCNQSSLVDIWTQTSVNPPESFIKTSGCSGGLTGFVENEIIPFEVTESISPSTIFNCIHQIYLNQDIYKASGGIHCSAYFEGEQMKYISEDIGRHNTLDKLTGMRLSNSDVSGRGILLTTGRISSEMIQKAYKMNAFAAATLTSPTSMAIEFADRNNITLIGYAKPNHFNVYTHPERLTNFSY